MQANDVKDAFATCDCGCARTKANNNRSSQVYKSHIQRDRDIHLALPELAAASEMQELRVRAAINYSFAIKGWWRRKRKIVYTASLCSHGGRGGLRWLAAQHWCSVREWAAVSVSSPTTLHARNFPFIHSLSISIINCEFNLWIRCQPCFLRVDNCWIMCVWESLGACAAWFKREITGFWFRQVVRKPWNHANAKRGTERSPIISPMHTLVSGINCLSVFF